MRPVFSLMLLCLLSFSFCFIVVLLFVSSADGDGIGVTHRTGSSRKRLEAGGSLFGFVPTRIPLGCQLTLMLRLRSSTFGKPVSDRSVTKKSQKL